MFDLLPFQQRGRGRMEGDLDTEKLRVIAKELEQMNLSLRRSPPPTLTEIRLYGLIWAHVTTSINLFLWEKYYSYVINLPPDTEEQERGEGPSPSRAIRDYIVRNNITCSESESRDGDEGPDPTYVAAKLFELMSQPTRLANFLRQLRLEVGLPQASNSKGLVADLDNVSEEMGGQDATSIKKPPTAVNEASSADKSSNEQTLLCILRNLEERRRSRRYAPPSDGEIRYYCEIKKWTNSSLSYIQGIRNWLKKQNPSDNKRLIHAHTPIEAYADLIWPGQKMAVALYEIPELQSLMEQCRHRFKETIVSFSGQQEAAMAVAEHVGDSEGKNDSHIREVIKKRKLDGLAAGIAIEDVHYGEAAAGDRLGSGARMRHLIDIWGTLLRMTPLTAAPTLRQIRLYAQLEEHFNSSIWMSEFKLMDYRQQGVETFELSEEDLDKLDSNADMESGEGKTREQYLEEIVCSVEAINSSFMCYPPTRQEAMMYRFLRSNMFSNFAYTQFFQMQGTDVGTKHIFSREEVAMLKHLIGLFCIKLEELLKTVSEQWLELLQIARIEVPTEVEAGDVLKWFCHDKGNKTQALTGLKDLLGKSSQGIEMLDHLTLILEEMSLIPVSCLSKLYSVSSSWSNQMYTFENYEIACMEISAALHTQASS